VRGALIRLETEMLVELALDEIRAATRPAPADVGTGSGAIAVAIAPNARRCGSSLSRPLTRRWRSPAQRRRYGLADRLDLRTGDLLEGAGAFDVIVANLPYVSAGDWPSLAPEISGHEPRAALVAGPSGTEVVERLLAEVLPHLAPGGLLAAEIGDTQAARVLGAARRCFREAQSYVMKDLGGRDRVLVVRNTAGG
jgi:release factor glutamine methyltransferase